MSLKQFPTPASSVIPTFHFVLFALLEKKKTVIGLIRLKNIQYYEVIMLTVDNNLNKI